MCLYYNNNNNMENKLVVVAQHSISHVLSLMENIVRFSCSYQVIHTILFFLRRIGVEARALHPI